MSAPISGGFGDEYAFAVSLAPNNFMPPKTFVLSLLEVFLQLAMYCSFRVTMIWPEVKMEL